MDYQWLVSPAILEEYQAVLNRTKLNINPDRRDRFLGYVEKMTTLIAVNYEIEFARDRKDAKFLACAVAGGADWLITGDKDFSEAQALIETNIIAVSAFNALFLAD